MKITEYPKLTDFSANTIFIIDGAGGTKTILASDLIKTLLKLGDLSKLNSVNWNNLLNTNNIIIETSSGLSKTNLQQLFWGLVDGVSSDAIKKTIYRGQNIGERPTDAQLSSISNGSFRGMFLGDYWVYNNINYRIVDFNYWAGTGSSGNGIDTNHVVIMPDSNLSNSAYFPTTANITAGYSNSYIMGTGEWVDVEDTVNNFVGNSDYINGNNHILTVNEYLSNSTNDGCVTSGVWENVKLVIPNELMMFGSYICAKQTNGSIKSDLSTIDRTQLKLYSVKPVFINARRKQFWLRDFASKTTACVSSAAGRASDATFDSEIGIRPVFAIC